MQGITNDSYRGVCREHPTRMHQQGPDTDMHLLNKNAVDCQVFSYWPSAKRVSPHDDQAVSTACLNPLVHVESVSGQTGFSRLSRGITKSCPECLHQLLLTDGSQCSSLLPPGGSHSERTLLYVLTWGWTEAFSLPYNKQLIGHDSANDIKSRWGGCVLPSEWKLRSIKMENLFRRRAINLYSYKPL